MSLKHYGMVKGRPLAHHRETDGSSPHYQIHLDAGGTSFRFWFEHGGRLLRVNPRQRYNHRLCTFLSLPIYERENAGGVKRCEPEAPLVGRKRMSLWLRRH